MPIGIMRCPKCGFTQKADSSCKSCGTAIEGQPDAPIVHEPVPPPESVVEEAPASPVVQEAPTVAMVQETSPEPGIQEVSQETSAEPSMDAILGEPSSDPVGDPLMESQPQGESETVAQVAPGSEPESDQIRQPFFFGTGGSLLGIHAVNTFLTLITAFIYFFWGKVKIRKYFFSQTEMEGDRFAYHGTGKELLIGFLKALVVLGTIFALLNALPFIPGNTAKVVVALFAYTILFLFIPVAITGARRYRLSRTSWREVRFSFRGKTKDFIKLFIKNSIFTALTLGLYRPIFETNVYAFLASHSYFGSQKFDFDGQGRDLLKSYILTGLLLIPTFGLCVFWYMAKKQRYLWDHTMFGYARFRCTVTGGRLLQFHLVNLLLLICSFGLAWTWVAVRKLRFTYTYLALIGPIDMAAIQQDAQIATATGEGLDALLELDTGFGPA